MEDKKLDRGLSLTMCITLVMGAIIGAGVFSFTGIGITYSGTGVVIAFIAAGLLTVYLTLPIMQLASSIPATGGTYMYVSRFIHPSVGYIQVLNTLIGTLNIAVMSISFTQYFTSIFPDVNGKLVGIGIILILAVAGTFGVKISGWVQNIVVGILLIALAVYIIPGFSSIKPEYINFTKMFQPLGGLAGLWAAIAVLRYTTMGGNIVIALGDEVKKPGFTIPFAFLIGTGIVTIIYAVAAYVTVGVLPIDQVAGQPLSVAAEAFLSGGWLQFFIIGGGLLATVTTLNGSFLIYSRLHFAAARDGIWPSFFKKTNKYKVPVATLWTAAFIGMVPVLFEFALSDVFMLVAVPGLLLGVIFYVPALLLPKRLPNCYKQAWFKMPNWLTLIVSVTSIMISFSLGMSLFRRMNPNYYLGMVVFYGLGFIYWFLRVKFLKEKKEVDLIEDMKGFHPYWIELEEKGKESV